MKKLLIDMDGVLVDFGKKVNEIDLDDTISMHFKKSPDEIEGVFRDLEPLKNAVKSVIKLYMICSLQRLRLGIIQVVFLIKEFG
jgi:hypothetical protein